MVVSRSKLSSGRAKADEELGLLLDRQQAIIAPYYDIEFGETGAAKYSFPNGDVVAADRGLPLLTFATR